MRLQAVVTLSLLIALVTSAPGAGTKDAHHTKTVRPGQSIQKAINDSKPGDRIIVEPGDYAEQLEITTSGISLIGKPKAVLVAPQKYKQNFCSGLNRDFTGAPTEAGICIHGKGIKLAEFKQDHKKVDSVDKFIKNVEIIGFEVRGFSGMNIVLYAGQDCKFKNNKLVDGGQYGFLTVYSKNTFAASNVVTSTTPNLNYIAMCMDDRSGTIFEGNKLSGYVIALCTQTPGGLVKGNTVKNCCIGPFVDPGIKGAKVIANTISNRNPACPVEAAAGILLVGSFNTLVEKNTVQSITSQNKKAVGLLLVDDDATGSKVSGSIAKYNLFKNNDIDIINNATSKPDTNAFKGNVCRSAFTTAGRAPYCNRF